MCLRVDELFTHEVDCKCNYFVFFKYRDNSRVDKNDFLRRYTRKVTLHSAFGVLFGSHKLSFSIGFFQNVLYFTLQLIISCLIISEQN